MGELTLPEHGGDLAWARRHFGGDGEDWLDLSTGISPWAWPVHAVPVAIWQRLPDTDDSALRRAAAEFYGCASEHVLPVPGSQFAISCLPRIVPRGIVALPNPGFAEHIHAWSAAGHTVVEYRNLDELAELLATGDIRYAVVINPNNPSAEQASPAQLLEWRSQLAAHNGLLVVDEAFADCYPQISLAKHAHLSGLVILRSVGKFFGLAGVRLGFVLACAAMLTPLQRWCNPWQINHPAQWIGTQALRDRDWQTGQRRRIAQHSAHMQEMLGDFFPAAHIGDAGLFLTLSDPSVSLYHRFIEFAKAQVLLRYGRSNAGEWLRFALPGDNLAAFQQRLEFILRTTT